MSFLIACHDEKDSLYTTEDSMVDKARPGFIQVDVFMLCYIPATGTNVGEVHRESIFNREEFILTSRGIRNI